MPKKGQRRTPEELARLAATWAAKPFPSRKRCPRCRKMLPIAMFSFRKTGSPRGFFRESYCDPCRRARGAERAKRCWRNASPERRAELLAANRAWRLLHRNGLRVEEWDARLAAQGGGCAICGAPKGRHGTFRLVVDHDHVTGAIRGLLCDRCNRAIGLLGDSVETLTRAAAYLAKTKEAQ